MRETEGAPSNFRETECEAFKIQETERCAFKFRKTECECIQKKRETISFLRISHARTVYINSRTNLFFYFYFYFSFYLCLCFYLYLCFYLCLYLCLTKPLIL